MGDMDAEMMTKQIVRLTVFVILPLFAVMLAAILIGQGQPDDRLAFASNRTGDFEIYLYDLRTSVIANISRSPGDDSYPQWNAVDHVLTYWSQRNGRNDEYFVWNPQTKETTKYERKSRERVSVVSPDERWIVGDLVGTGVVVQDLQMLRTGALTVSPMMLTTPGVQMSEPVWSLDSRYLAFSGRNFANENYDVYLVEILSDGTPANLRRLTNHPAVDSHPAWVGN
jgi:Tol biopolymer transport system component